MPWYEHHHNAKLVYTNTVPRTKVYKAFLDSDRLVEFMNENEDFETEIGTARILSLPIKKTEKEITLPSGSYYYEQIERYPSVEALVPFTFRKDSFIGINCQKKIAEEEIISFIRDKDHYKELGIIHKRGLLFYGPPGEGKTSFIRSLLTKVIPEDSIIITLDSLPSKAFLNELNSSTGERLKVFVFEEFATIATDQSRIHKVLDFLDGETSVNNSIIIATTNYPQMLPSNIVDRPNRFDRLIKFGNPDQEGIRALLTAFLRRDPTEDEVIESKGLSASALKEASIQSITKQVSLTSIYKQLKAQSELAKQDFAEPRQLGIRRNDDD